MQKIITILFVLLLISSCDDDDFEIQNLNNNTISPLGHGGMGIGHTYPLNSFESIQNCLSIGAAGTEIDVQMTKDGVLVAFHDERLEHSTDKEGQIFNQSWSEIKDASYKFPLYTDHKVRTLEEIFSNIDNKDEFTFFLDIKKFNTDTSAVLVNRWVHAITDLMDDQNLTNNVFVEFKTSRMIRAMNASSPHLQIFAYNNFEKAMELASEFDVVGITVAVDEISKEEVAEAHDNNFMVAVFNAHSKSRNSDAIEMNVDFVQSDKVKHLVKVLEE